MTREELDERLKNILGLDNWQYSTMPHEVEQLIRDCIGAVTPEKVMEIEADTYSAGVHDGINHCVSDVEANTKELLG